MTTDTAILKRIAALLALSEDDAATPNEVAVAARKAQELMARHRLSRAEVMGDDPEQVRQDDEPLVDAKRMPLWVLGLANTVAQNNRCFNVVYRDTATQRKRLVIIGRAEDVELVRYLFTYLRREIDRIARQYRRAGAFIEPGTQTRFRVGCVTAISMALARAQQEAERGASSRAVVRVRKGYDEAHDWAFANIPGLKTNAATFEVSADDRAFSAGLRAGSRISLHPGVENGTEPKKLKGREK